MHTGTALMTLTWSLTLAVNTFHRTLFFEISSNTAVLLEHMEPANTLVILTKENKLLELLHSRQQLDCLPSHY